MEWNQSRWMHCLLSFLKKERGFSRLPECVSTCHAFVVRPTVRVSRFQFWDTPRTWWWWNTSGASECVSFPDTRNYYFFFFFTVVCTFPRIQWTIDHLYTISAPNFSRSWFTGLIRVNEQKCRFRKWRKLEPVFNLNVWFAWISVLTFMIFSLKFCDYLFFYK